MCALEVVVAKRIPWRDLLCWGLPQGCHTCPWGAFPQAALPIALGFRGLCRLAGGPSTPGVQSSGCLRGSSLEEQFRTWVTCPQSPMLPITVPPQPESRLTRLCHPAPPPSACTPAYPSARLLSCSRSQNWTNIRTVTLAAFPSRKFFLPA